MRYSITYRIYNKNAHVYLNLNFMSWTLIYSNKPIYLIFSVHTTTAFYNSSKPSIAPYIGASSGWFRPLLILLANPGCPDSLSEYADYILVAFHPRVTPFFLIFIFQLLPTQNSLFYYLTILAFINYVEYAIFKTFFCVIERYKYKLTVF